MPFLQGTYPPEILVLVLLFFLVSLIQLLFIWVLHGRLGLTRPRRGDEATRPVSVIICARDEYHNLKENLPFILHQDYPDFEVIVVNDASDDDTGYLLEDLAKDYPHLQPVTIHSDLNFFKGKKFPLSIGIKSAHKPYLLLTDADCRPTSRHWLRKMQSHFSEEKRIVLGYGSYRTRNSLLHMLVRFDTVSTAMRYMSWALAGIPYMGVGRNLAYHRDLFFGEGGFLKHYSIPSGDDDLFINKVATPGNTAVVSDPEAITVSKAPERFRLWLRQKRRHLLTGGHYRPLHRLLLGLDAVSALLFYALFIALMILRVEPMIIAGVFIIRMLSYAFVLKKTMIRLQERDLLLLSPVLEVFFLLTIPLLALSNKIFRKTKWK
ncbi:MAG TPA: glycosyltransferase [Bacteroidales bacterium]|nr:glycosyltransferase [Bacteroidales bacterium]